MRPILAACCAAAMLMIPGPAQAWGPIGHRVAAELADRFVCGQTRLEIRELLGPETPADAANWADYMRLSPDPEWHDKTYPWHFVTIPDGKTYAEAGAPAEGDAISALAAYRATVLDADAPLEERRAALRMVIHIVGDLNQPLHAGNDHDRGGNDVTVTLRGGEQTNLHALWDSGLIDMEQMSYREWADYLQNQLTAEEAIAWATTDPATWANESRALHSQVYPATDQIDGTYIFRARPLLHQQMTKAGLRLASTLNAMFGHCAGVGAEATDARGAPASR
ncbi:S1/P1 nuclease [Croceibacterium sp. TMG7-5b_MA50]|uniref:S1/P1 nuclease n=1 Tax=Croceibacterium sp. TMG7-5b_MA50 TaxID=3121290 RepID=UPI0032213B6C